MKRKALPWPTEGKNPFASDLFTPRSTTWINLEWMKGWIDDSTLSVAYKESADRVIRQLSREKRHRHHDALFLPIVYLYRHCFELQLKHIIRIGINLDVLSLDGKLEKLLKSHNLCQLWKYVDTVCSEVCDGSNKEEDFINAGKIIKGLHDVDRSGETLRYSKDLKGEKHTYPKYVELKSVRGKCNELYNFLEGVEAALQDALSMINEGNSF